MRLFIPVLTIIFASCASVQAASNQGSGGGILGFSCDVNTMTCKCTGDIRGADCEAMRDNCVSVEGIVISCSGQNCTCRLKPRAIMKAPPAAGQKGKTLLSK